MIPAREREKRIGKLRPFEKRVLTVAVALVMLIAGFSVYYSIGNTSGKPTLVVYTYPSFLTSGSNPKQAYAQVFGTFEKEYGVNIVVKRPSRGLIQTLELQGTHPQANIVIGLNNIDAVEAVQQGLLAKYQPPATEYINRTLMEELGSAVGYLTPYEYAYLGIDYNMSLTGGAILKTDFQDIAVNHTLAGNLLMEYPELSATGEAFLLWEISFYTYILHQNWTAWWSQMKQYASDHIFDSWSQAFSRFETGAGTNMVVSYATDPAYFRYFNQSAETNSTLIYYNGTAYGWRTIYGIGIVNHSENTALSEKFVNYFLSPVVQNELPLNEWMYPANSTVRLPGVYRYAVNESAVFPLNNYLNATDIQLNIENWLDEWIELMG